MSKPLEELKQDYSNIAAQVGHKSMQVDNTQELIEKVELEIFNHKVDMKKLVKDIDKLEAEAREAAQEAAKVKHIQEVIEQNNSKADIIDVPAISV